MLMIIFLFPTLKSIFGCWRSWCCCCCCMWNSFSKITVEFAGWLLPPWGLPNERCDELNCDYFCRQRDGQREQKSRKLCCSSRFLVSFHTHLNLESSFCVFFCCLLACFCFNFWSCPGMARESEEGKTSQTKLHQRLSRARTVLTRGLSVLLYFFPPIQTTAFILTGPQLQTLDKQQRREFTGRTKAVKGCHINHQMTVKCEMEERKISRILF